ncbi:hypothetical protein MTR_5g078570 [Medicago truncatula]|uniref:Uncharacterized protein n=1 Tax=Medicago truncatula TaxID=3880 RepID=G7K1S4_MEDTR|nr:hypothetical protein MTR_5g078570 [Medicago truncatula]
MNDDAGISLCSLKGLGNKGNGISEVEVNEKLENYKEARKQELLSEESSAIFTQVKSDEISGNATYGTSDSVSPAHIIGIRVEKSGEFSYEQLVTSYD